MLVVLPYCHKDRDQAIRMLSWLSEMASKEFIPVENLNRHKLLIVRDSNAERIQHAENRYSLFEAIVEITCPNAEQQWPQGPNAMFRTAGKHIQYAMGAEPFLWLEPDAVPLRWTAFDEIEQEYRQALKQRRPFLGDLVTPPPQAGPNFVSHMSGIGVYPGRLTEFAGEIFWADTDPFDVHAAHKIMGQMAKSNLILHQWKAPAFETVDDVQKRIFDVKPKAAIYHANKDGTLIERLREMRESAEHFERRTEALKNQIVAPKSLPTASLDPGHPGADQTVISLVVVPMKWGNLDDMRRFLEKISAMLKDACDSPTHTSMVRQALRKAGVIEAKKGKRK